MLKFSSRRFRWPCRAVLALVPCLGIAGCLAAFFMLSSHAPPGPAWQCWSILFASFSLTLLTIPWFGYLYQGARRVKWAAARHARKLRENEKNVWKLLDSVHAGIVIIDAKDHTIVDVNSTAVDMIGAPAEEIVGAGRHQYIRPAEKGQCPVTDLGRNVDQSEGALLTAAGERIPVLKTVVSVYLNGHRHLLESLIDITDRKQAESVLRAQRDLSAAIGAARNLHEALERCLAATLEISGMDCGAIYLASRDGGLDIAAQQGLSPALLKSVLHYGPGDPPLNLLREAKPVYYSRNLFPEKLTTSFRREGLASGVLLPMHHDGQLVACLGVASRGRKTFSAWDRHELEACAAHASETIGRLLAEEAMREGQKNLQTLFDTIDEFAFVLDCDGRIVHFNRLLQERLGYAPEELRGMQIVRLHPEENQSEVLSALAPLAKRTSAVSDVPFLAKDGRQIPAETTYSRGKWSNRDVVFGMARDVTERKLAELQQRQHARALEAANEALKKSYRAAEAANEAKNAFLANMSHELRTPLHSILSFSAFGTQKSLEGDREGLREYFELIQRSGEMLLTLVDDLLDLATLEAGKTNLALQKIDLHALCLQVADELRPLAAERGLTILCAEPACEAFVDADQTQLHQVFRNLLGNAIKFSPNGGAIELGLRRADRSFFVSVSDQGLGIPEDELDAVFEKFFQSSRTSTGAGGTGLGLAICREIMTAHHGRVWAENRPEGGTVVTLEIPLAPPKAGAEDAKVKTSVLALPEMAGIASPE